MMTVKTIEAPICSVDALQDGQMKQFSLGDRPILVAHSNGEFYAIAAHCSHAGAPLEEGILSGDRVICPWHNACFNLFTGQQQEPPGLDDLARFETWVQEGQVYVRVPEALPQQMPPTMASYDPSREGRTFVIIGAGAAGIAAVEQLRQSGFQGKIQLVTAETTLPYSRTSLSKAYLQDDHKDGPAPLRSHKFYAENGIEILTGKQVERVDTQEHQIHCADGSQLSYDKLLIATGGKARSLDIPGADFAGVYTLRTADDAQQVLDRIQCKHRAVIVGSSFIGMEAASSLKQQGLDVVVISPDSVPLERVLGRQVGEVFRELHEEQGIKFRFNDRAAAFSGDGELRSVHLQSGDIIPADLVVVGIGVDPATKFLDDSFLQPDQSILVDAHFQADADIFAAGDIATFPSPQTRQPVRIEHWRLAMQQGRIAAKAMAGEQAKFSGVPFFWTGQFDLKLRYVGHAEEWDHVIIHGDLASREFLAFYVRHNQILAVAGCGRDRDIAAISELMRLQQMPLAQDLAEQELERQDWRQRLTQITPKFESLALAQADGLSIDR